MRGTGLTGTYATPSSPYAFIAAYSYDPLYVYAGGSTNGLYTPNNTAVLEVSTGVDGAFSFTIPPAVPSPDVYFASKFGTYAVTATSDNYVAGSGGGTMQYTPTSFTIGTTSPVPEPGTWAAAVLLVGGAGLMRWHKRAKAS